MTRKGKGKRGDEVQKEFGRFSTGSYGFGKNGKKKIQGRAATERES